MLCCKKRNAGRRGFDSPRARRFAYSSVKWNRCAAKSASLMASSLSAVWQASAAISLSMSGKYNCSLVRLDYQQEQGLMSSLPLGASHIQIERSLTTSSVAVFVPFVTQELFQGGDAMYYGINAKTGNMIMLDRKRARCPNGLKLGTPGSGKSMSCKSEIVSVFLLYPGRCVYL